MRNVKWLSRQTCRRGYTLIELIVSIVILCIMITIAAPTYKKYTIHARKNEAYMGIEMISKLEKIFYRDHKFFAGAVSTPHQALIGPKGFRKYWWGLGADLYRTFLANPFTENQVMDFTFTTVSGNAKNWRIHYIENNDGDLSLGTSVYNGPNTSYLTGVFGPSDSVLGTMWCWGFAAPYASTAPTPGSLITPLTLGVTPPDTGTYEWLLIFAQSGLEDEDCHYVYTLLEARSSYNAGRVTTGGISSFSLDFSDAYHRQ